MDKRSVGEDLGSGHGGHGTGCDRLWRTFDLDQTHSTVTGDGESIMVTASGGRIREQCPQDWLLVVTHNRGT